MIDLTEEIRAGYNRGWSFTPLRGKRPYLDAWQQAPRESLEQAVEWAGQGNVGLRTGAASGIAVIDIDIRGEDGDYPGDLARTDFPSTVCAWTGGGGFHLYYRCTLPVPNIVGKNKPGILNGRTGEPCKADVRGDGGQVVFVGSTHPETQKLYHWLQFQTPADTILSEFPYYLLIDRPNAPTPAPQPAKPRPTVQHDRVPAYARTALDREIAAVAQAQEGGRNDRLNVAAFNLGQLVGAGILEEQLVVDDLLAAATTSGLDDFESGRTIRSGMEAGKAQPRRTVPQQQPQPQRVVSVAEIGAF